MPTGFPQVDDLPVAGCRFSSVPTAANNTNLAYSRPAPLFSGVKLGAVQSIHHTVVGQIH